MKKILFTLLVMALASTAFAANYDSKWTNPPDKQVVVTPSDTVPFDPPLVAIDIGVAGDVRVVLTRDIFTFDCTTAPTHLTRPIGLFNRRIYLVCATGTTATNIIGYPSDPNR